MDERVKSAIESHEDFSRLKKAFPLDFVVECLTNPRRSPKGARFIGHLLNSHSKNPSLFISAIHYHELVELEKFRKLGYSDNQLGENHSKDSNRPAACDEAKKKELDFYNFVALKIDGKTYPNLSWPFSNISVMGEYNMSTTPYEILSKMVSERKGLYGKKFTFENVKSCIDLLRLGGDECLDQDISLSYAKRYLSGEREDKSPDVWMMA